MTDARVRLAGVGDADALARLLVDFNEEFETETDPVEVLMPRFARILTDDAAFALLAEEAGAAVGFALVTLRPAIWFDGPVATLDELYVVPRLRDRGLGTAVLTTARDRLAERGCPELHINVDEVDTDARRFYERQGFVNVEPGTEDRMLCYIGSTRRA